jgi:hypothetical protein
MDPSSAPLADYFWIAGVDSVSYNDLPEMPLTPSGLPPVEDSTIAEDSEDEQPEAILGSAPRGGAARHSRNSSFSRLSRLSLDARNSIQSLDALEGNGNGNSGSTKSNRSSMTVRAMPMNGTVEPTTKSGLSDFDFDRALVKFANERENFLDDLTFSAGTVLHARPPMTNRAERLRHEEDGGTGRKSPFGRVGGSIRRKISFRDLNSAKKQTVNRASEWDLFAFIGDMCVRLRVWLSLLETYLHAAFAFGLTRLALCWHLSGMLLSYCLTA